MRYDIYQWESDKGVYIYQETIYKKSFGEVEDYICEYMWCDYGDDNCNDFLIEKYEETINLETRSRDLELLQTWYIGHEHDQEAKNG